MLRKFTDRKGQQVWLDDRHVVGLFPNDDDSVAVTVVTGIAGINLKGRIDDIARELNGYYDE